jgi:hypothetical protein
MQERLQQLGWREIEVVDEDLGRSAAGTVTLQMVKKRSQEFPASAIA